MHFSSEQLDQLAPSGVIRPTGLNDDQRVDMTDHPFLAIDPARSGERDDAVRVQRTKGGGFVVDTAIVDGAQVPVPSEVFDVAVDGVENEYKGRYVLKRILPLTLTKELSLEHNSIKRALVISERFNRDGFAVAGDATITPATVQIHTMSHMEFGRTYLRNLGSHITEDPIIQFDRAARDTYGLPYSVAESAGGSLEDWKYAQRVVQLYMVMANMAIAQWSIDNAVPIIFRDFDALHELRDYTTGPNPGATYTTEPYGHDVPIGGWLHDSDANGWFDGAPPYTRATSPLRRAVDLVNHVQIGHHLAGQSLPFATSDLTDLATRFNSYVPSL